MSLMGYTSDEIESMSSAVENAIEVLSLNIDFIVIPNKKDT